eukprot:7386063-Prymnesium_polylepis.1
MKTRGGGARAAPGLDCQTFTATPFITSKWPGLERRATRQPHPLPPNAYPGLCAAAIAPLWVAKSRGRQPSCPLQATSSSRTRFTTSCERRKLPPRCSQRMQSGATIRRSIPEWMSAI